MKNSTKPNNKIRVGIDLDGVVVDKPWFVPKALIEWLFRAHHNHSRKYRIPTWKPEIILRKISHHWAFRKPIKDNISLIKKLAKSKSAEVYLISGRFSFLEQETNRWLKKNKLDKVLPPADINQKNIQPHLFKEEKAKKLKLDFFFDDDPIIIDHFAQKAPQVKAKLISKQNKKTLEDLINSLG